MATLIIYLFYCSVAICRFFSLFHVYFYFLMFLSVFSNNNNCSRKLWHWANVYSLKKLQHVFFSFSSVSLCSLLSALCTTFNFQFQNVRFLFGFYIHKIQNLYLALATVEDSFYIFEIKIMKNREKVSFHFCVCESMSLYRIKPIQINFLVYVFLRNIINK